MSLKRASTIVAVLAVLAGQAVAGVRHHPNGSLRDSGRFAPERTLPGDAFARDVEGFSRPSHGYDGFPTDYLTNRSGDFQLQGR